MSKKQFPSACIYAVAQLLIENMEHNPEMDCYFLPEGKSFITLPTGIVNVCKKEFKTAHIGPDAHTCVSARQRPKTTSSLISKS